MSKCVEKFQRKVNFPLTPSKGAAVIKTPVKRDSDLFCGSSSKKKNYIETPDKPKKKINHVFMPLSNQKNDFSNVNICVAVRIRPPTQKEVINNDKCILNATGDEIIIEGGESMTNGMYQAFRFDHVFSYKSENNYPFRDQENVFKEIAIPLLDASVEGYNVCLFAYGQTGSGKTYSMMGANGTISGSDAGIVPRFGNELLSRKTKLINEDKLHISVSYFEIYNEKIYDLLGGNNQSKSQLKVREHPVRGPYVENLTSHLVDSSEAFLSMIIMGNSRRATGTTSHNDRSSRSHAILEISIIKSSKLQSTRSKISLIDLAGSERSSYASGNERFKESLSINKSLLTLGKVVTALSDTKSGNFVPYRDSILTWLLRNSLGGDSRTVMLATVSPVKSALDETLATLRWASKARHIICSPKKQEDPHLRLINDLKIEIEQLKSMKQNFLKVEAGQLESNLQSESNKIDINDHMKILENQQRTAEEKLKFELEKLEFVFKNSEKLRAELQVQNEILLNGIAADNVTPYQTDYFEHLKNTLETSFSQLSNDDMDARTNNDVQICNADGDDIISTLLQLQKSTSSLQSYIQLYNMGDRATVLINIVQKSMTELTDIITSHLQ